MSLGSTFVVVALSAAITVGLVAPADAEEPVAATLTVQSSAAYAGAESTVRMGLTAADGAPLADAQVQIERREEGGWAEVEVVTTDAEGQATSELLASRDPMRNTIRVSYAGDETYGPSQAATTIELKRRSSVVTLKGPASVVDGHKLRLKVRWQTRNGQPIAGRVGIFRASGSGKLKLYGSVRTGTGGRATFTSSPRRDSRWQVRAPRLAWVEGDRSDLHRVRIRPPGEPVRLPQAAPRPRIHLPSQARGAGHGPHLTVSAIPDGMWRHMVGVSWHSGCPVGRSGLRVVRINYWDYSGYKRRGELVASAAAAPSIGAALAEMYRRDLPIRAMYRVDRFGWAARSQGGDDYASMAAGNTSAFNCRDVTGRPGTRSPHSYGGSLDLNTWENPYRSARGTVPNTWWQGHAHPRVAWRSRSHAVVALMARHGLRWTYGLGDTQHFDYVGSRGRAMVEPVPCHRYCD